MAILTLADALAPDPNFVPTDDSVDRRYQYLDRYRRVRVGPAVTVVFENRQTLWFRMQELAQIARLTDPGRVQQQLDWYARLLPGGDTLTAAVWVAVPGSRPGRELAALRRAVAGGRIGFRAADGAEVVGRFRTDRVADHLIGLAHWAEFRLAAADKAAFADAGRGWRVFVEAEGYAHASEPLTEDVRRSLLADLD
jgi:hypothetical protein